MILPFLSIRPHSAAALAVRWSALLGDIFTKKIRSNATSFLHDKVRSPKVNTLEKREAFKMTIESVHYVNS